MIPGRCWAGGALAVLALAAQAYGQATSAKPQTQQPVTAPPKPPESPKASGGGDPVGLPVDPAYLIGAEDILYIKVWREPELTGPHLVRPDGKITLELVGDLQAGGLTPERLAAQITHALSEVMNNPQVTVTVSQVNSKKYYITGEVTHTGANPLVVPTTVLNALGNAGGFKDFANKKKITILRNGKTLKFNYNEVIKGKKLEQNILLQNGDHVIVP